MRNLFNTIATIVPTMHGWATVEKASTLASMVLSLRPEIVVEVGVWGGRSLIPMALACKTIGKGVVYAVDPWMASVSKEGQNGMNFKWWSTANHEYVYEDFLKRLHDTATQGVVRVHRMKSDDFDPPDKIGVFSLDGNHGPQVIKDVQRYAPSVMPGGLIVMDDLDWDGGAVTRAAELLKEFNFIKLYRVKQGDDDYAVYQRLK